MGLKNFIFRFFFLFPTFIYLDVNVWCSLLQKMVLVMWVRSEFNGFGTFVFCIIVHNIVVPIPSSLTYEKCIILYFNIDFVIFRTTDCISFCRLVLLSYGDFLLMSICQVQWCGGWLRLRCCKIHQLWQWWNQNSNAMGQFQEWWFRTHHP